MNERIKELYNQCFVELKNGTPNVGFDFEKFAELIIRECVEIAYEYDAPKMSGPGMIIAGRIEQHFGVE